MYDVSIGLKSPRWSSPPISRTTPSPSSASALHPHTSTTRFTRLGSAGIVMYGHPSSSRPAAEPAPKRSCVPMAKASTSSAGSPWHRPIRDAGVRDVEWELHSQAGRGLD